MLLNLREIIEIPGASVDFETELETDRLDFPAIKEYKAKPKAVGRVYNEAGILNPCRRSGRAAGRRHFCVSGSLSCHTPSPRNDYRGFSAHCQHKFLLTIGVDIIYNTKAIVRGAL